MGRRQIERYLADLRPWEDPEEIGKGIKPDRRPWYARGDVKAGVPAVEAFYHHIDGKQAARYFALDLMGYGDEANRDDEWPAEELVRYDSEHREYKRLKMSLEERLEKKLKDGDLQARGFSSNAALDSSRQSIAPERWKDLDLDVKTSTATSPNLTITQILIFRPLQQPPEMPAKRSIGRTPPDQVRVWYLKWLATNVARGTGPKRKNDEAAARAVFGDKVTRDTIRALRRELAPASWTKRGRRPMSPKREGS